MSLFIVFVIPHLMRNLGILAGVLAKYILLCGPLLDPASSCGVTRRLDVVSRNTRTGNTGKDECWQMVSFFYSCIGSAERYNSILERHL